VVDEADGKMQEEKIFMDANHFDESIIYKRKKQMDVDCFE